mgnify:CR=1 FL=1
MNSEYVMQILNEMLTLAAIVSFPLLGVGIFCWNLCFPFRGLK